MKHIKIRLLNMEDLNDDFTEVLNVINPVKYPEDDINWVALNTIVYVAEEYFPYKIVGTLTLILCEKFGGKLGLIEDVAVLPEYERRGIGKILVKYALSEAERIGCYKVILLCLDDNIPFYEKCGMAKYQNCMCKKMPKYYDRG